MRIISWNVNGVRANHKKGAWNWLIDESPDIFCLQETKAEPEQLPDEVRDPLGYFPYFAHSKMRKGYSGVAIYTKKEPIKVTEGIGIKELDQEGRALVAEFDDFVLINCYFPNGGRGPDRLEHKMEYYKEFLKKINKIRKTGKSVIFCGDVNTAHNEIDLARPKENVDNTGFLPMERAWIDEVIENNYVDIWRNQHIDQKDSYTYWDMKTGARERNVGWRIDYFFVSDDISKKVTNSTIHSDIFGSDHCPISITVNL